MMAWICRFAWNLKTSYDVRFQRKLTANEINEAEMFILKIVQKWGFSGEEEKFQLVLILF